MGNNMGQGAGGESGQGQYGQGGQGGQNPGQQPQDINRQKNPTDQGGRSGDFGKDDKSGMQKEDRTGSTGGTTGGSTEAGA